VAALAFTLLAVIIVGLTGLSRVYMGVHFPSDVMGGYFIGAMWCLACFLAWCLACFLAIYGRVAV
jgi:membrane-associated phospholipid phosphatase